MILHKKTLKYYLLATMAHLGDTGLEFLMNDVAKGKRVYLGRKRYRSDYCQCLLRRFTTTGYIERIDKNGVSYLRLTPLAKTNLHNDIPLPSLQKRRWQDRFYGIAYDFPEKKRYQRRELRELIKSWGLGQFQLSVWITPHPMGEVIDEFILANNLQNVAFRFSTKKMSIEQGMEIAEKTWNVLQLKKSYQKFINKWYLKEIEKKLKPTDKPVLEMEFFLLLEKDPHLPFDLLPADWPADEAKDTYLAVKQKLLNLK